MKITIPDNIICTHFLKNYGVNGKISEEKLLDNISSNLFQNVLSGLADVGLEQTISSSTYFLLQQKHMIHVIIRRMPRMIATRPSASFKSFTLSFSFTGGTASCK
jgi:hypothetical protein